MKLNIYLYSLILILEFGQISCSSDKNTSMDSFDFNVRIYSHNQTNEQQLRSFGNSNVSANDYLILYSGNDLFPVWDKNKVLHYKNTQLQKTIVNVYCYDSQNQKQQKTTEFTKASFRVFETLPLATLLSDAEIVSCEYILQGISSKGVSLYIAKMLTIILDVSSAYRLFPSIQATRIYMPVTILLQQLQQHSLIQTDTLTLLCRQTDASIQAIEVLTEDQSHIFQIADLQLTNLQEAVACRFVYSKNNEKNVSEIFILKNKEIEVTHTFFRDFRKNGENHFYTFRLQNQGTKRIQVHADPDQIITTSIYYERISYPQKSTIKEVLRFSKPTVAENTIQLDPGEVAELYVHYYQFVESTGLSQHSSATAVTDIQIDFAESGLTIKEVSDSPYSIGVKVPISAELRKEVEGRKRSKYIRQSP